MTRADIVNTSLWRLRQHGVNFGGSPTDGASDQNPPYIMNLLANQGYAEFVERTRASQIVTLKTFFLTTLNATVYPLRPLPLFTDGVTPNPAVMRVLEVTYTQQTGLTNAGYEYGVELISTTRFKALAGDYTRRYSWFGPRVLYAARLYRKPFLDVLPGCATAGDFIGITVVPDIANAPAGLTCAMGGPMQGDNDVPLIPPQYHLALVDYIVWQAGDALDKSSQVQAAKARWDAAIDEALGEGSTEDGGDSVGVLDIYSQPLVRDAVGLDG